jgi:hypothetical protein
MRITQAPAYYSCYNNIQLVGNINVQNIFDLNNPQQRTIADIINSRSTSPVDILYFSTYRSVSSFDRVIHVHRFNIHIALLSLIYESMSMLMTHIIHH